VPGICVLARVVVANRIVRRDLPANCSRRKAVMGSLRRCASIRCAGLEEGVVQEKRRTPAVIPDDLKKVSCGPCTLTVTAHGSGLVHIVVRTQLASWNPGEKERLLEALNRVLALGVDYFATFDLRAHQQVNPHIVKILTGGLTGGECWRRLRAAVVQVRENIFTTVRMGIVSAFVRTCLLDPFGPVGSTGCPLLICRDDGVAREFCEASHRAYSVDGRMPSTLASAPGFVSLDNISDGNAGVDSVVAKDCCAGCVASLAPGIRRRGRGAPVPSGVASAGITTLHELPNGDVRVIQSPARDVVLSSTSPSGNQDEVRGRTVAPAPSTGSMHSSASGAELSRSVAALKFECPAERLQPLVGTHLHVGELVFDAEVESCKRRYTACVRSVPKASLLPILWSMNLGECWKGVLAFLLRRRMAKKAQSS